MKDTPIGSLLISLDNSKDIAENDFYSAYNFLDTYYKDKFKNSKEYSDIDVTNCILKFYIEEKDTKTWIKYQLFAILKTTKRLYDKIKYFRANSPELLENEINLFKELLVDISFFLQFSFSYLDEKPTELIKFKDFYLEPKEILSASRLLLRNHVLKNHPGNSASRYASVFFIRQSIEVLIKNIFGVSYIYNDKGEPQKIQPELFFEFIDDSKVNNDFPLPKNTIKNIHGWTQSFVHAGFIPYLWQIEWTQVMLEPLFDFQKVILKQHFYNDLETIIKSKFERKINIHRTETNHYYSTVKN